MLPTILMLIGALGGHAISWYRIMDHIESAQMKENNFYDLITYNGEKLKYVFDV